MFATLLGVNDRVFSPAQVRAMLPIDVQVMLPARFQVNMFAALLGVNDEVFSPAQVWAMLPTRFRVNLYASLWVNMFTRPFSVDDKVIQAIYGPVVLPAQFWVNKFAAYSWVNEIVPFGWLNEYVVHAHSHKSECAEYYASVDQVNDMMACIQIGIAVHASVDGCVVQGNELASTPAILECGDYFNNVQLNHHNSLSIFKKSHVSIWRHPTAHYNVTGYPYFVFHPKQSEFSNFSETFKGYACCLLQYRLIHVIEFVVCWSNHMCHFMLQNMTMLVNFDLTPQQYCQRLHFTMCRSQFYKHDFAVISSSPGPSANYLAVSFVKYLESIICQIIQHKYLHKMSIWSSAKEDSKSQITNCFEPPEHDPSGKIGGGQHGPIRQKIEMEVIRPFIINLQQNSDDDKICEFVEHLEMSKGLKKYKGSNYLLCDIPLHLLTNCLFQNTIIPIGHKHNIHISKRMAKSEISKLFKIHDEICEHKYVTVFCPYTQISSSERGLKYREVKKPQVNNDSDVKQPESLEIDTSIHNTFPPAPPDASLCRKIINGFCDATNPSKFEEAGCAVCGALTLQTELFDLSSLNIDLSVLNTTGLGFTRKERKYSAEPISELDGPAIDTSCDYICISCKDKVRLKKLPKFALARGLWLGAIPDELQQLSFAEKLLIGRVRHNQCVVRVAKGMHKMIANAVTFEHPMQKIYTVLPPPIEEMDEVLAFIFTGPCQPTEDDFQRIPLLVRRNKVAKALEWLKLNHSDYADLEISYKNLESYPEDSPPVVINY